MKKHAPLFPIYFLKTGDSLCNEKMVTQKLKDIARVFSSCGLSTMLVDFGFGQHLPLLDRHVRAQRDVQAGLCEALAQLGGVYLGFAQHLARNTTLFDSAISRAILATEDHTSVTADELRAELSRSLGRADFLTRLDPRPLHQTPLFQTHKARLTTGEPVSIKVRRPHSPADMHALRYISHKLARHEPAILLHFAHFENTLNVDLRHEARNLTNLSSQSTLAIPRVHEHYSNSTILTTDFQDGTPLSHLPLHQRAPYLGTLTKHVASEGLAFDSSILVPHNLLVLPNGRLSFYDFGGLAAIPASKQFLADFAEHLRHGRPQETAAFILRHSRVSAKTNVDQYVSDVAGLHRAQTYLESLLALHSLFSDNCLDAAPHVSRVLDTVSELLRIRHA